MSRVIFNFNVSTLTDILDHAVFDECIHSSISDQSGLVVPLQNDEMCTKQFRCSWFNSAELTAATVFATLQDHAIL